MQTQRSQLRRLSLDNQLVHSEANDSLRLAHSLPPQLNLYTLLSATTEFTNCIARRNQKCTECGTTAFSRNTMSAESVHLSTFGAETETEAEIRSTSIICVCYHRMVNKYSHWETRTLTVPYVDWYPTACSMLCSCYRNVIKLCMGRNDQRRYIRLLISTLAINRCLEQVRQLLLQICEELVGMEFDRECNSNAFLSLYHGCQRLHTHRTLFTEKR